MAFYRDTFSRISLPMVRAQLKPARFREARSIRLEKFGFTVEVNLARVPSPTSYGGERVFFKVPSLELRLPRQRAWLHDVDRLGLHQVPALARAEPAAHRHVATTALDYGSGPLSDGEGR